MMTTLKSYKSKQKLSLNDETLQIISTHNLRLQND